eukprot:Gb_35416 [translate_table: standard]
MPLSSAAKSCLVRDVFAGFVLGAHSKHRCKAYLAGSVWFSGFWVLLWNRKTFIFNFSRPSLIIFTEILIFIFALGSVPGLSKLHYHVTKCLTSFPQCMNAFLRGRRVHSKRDYRIRIKPKRTNPL